MKVKKILSIAMIGIVLITSISSGNIRVNATINNDEYIFCDEYIPFEKATMLKEIDTISIKNSLMVDGVKNYLYPTYDNKSEALENIKNNISNVLSIIMEKENYNELSNENWKDYYSTLSIIKGEYDDEKRLAESFFDIYKNDELNNSIIECVGSDIDTEEKRQMLYELLPYNTPYSEAYLSEMVKTYSSFDESAAVSYARRYAETPNYNDYEVFDSDCTNFVSQIMENAGVEQDNSVEWPWRGWWHTQDGNSHYHSRSWTVADKFAKYFGVGYTTQSNYWFSVKLRDAVFIVLDTSSDGSWDHAGFVCQSDTYLTDGYYDYLVAQHSDNYLDWASHDGNRWEEQENDGATYGIIYP